MEMVVVDSVRIMSYIDAILRKFIFCSFRTYSDLQIKIQRSPDKIYSFLSEFSSKFRQDLDFFIDDVQIFVHEYPNMRSTPEEEKICEELYKLSVFAELWHLTEIFRFYPARDACMQFTKWLQVFLVDLLSFLFT